VKNRDPKLHKNLDRHQNLNISFLGCA